MPLTELCVPADWEASLLACATHLPRRPLPWITWAYSGLPFTPGPALAGVLLFFPS